MLFPSEVADSNRSASAATTNALRLRRLATGLAVAQRRILSHLSLERRVHLVAYAFRRCGGELVFVVFFCALLDLPVFQYVLRGLFVLVHPLLQRLVSTPVVLGELT